MPRAATVVHSLNFEAVATDSMDWDDLEEHYDILIRIVLASPAKISIEYSSDGDYWQTWHDSVGRKAFCIWLERGLAGNVSKWTSHFVRTARGGQIEFNLRCGTNVRLNKRTVEEIVAALQA